MPFFIDSSTGCHLRTRCLARGASRKGRLRLAGRSKGVQDALLLLLRAGERLLPGGVVGVAQDLLQSLCGAGRIHAGQRQGAQWDAVLLHFLQAGLGMLARELLAGELHLDLADLHLVVFFLGFDLEHDGLPELLLELFSCFVIGFLDLHLQLFDLLLELRDLVGGLLLRCLARVLVVQGFLQLRGKTIQLLQVSRRHFGGA
mmetsp:Transcript_30903/g.66491  ORF Transcript_30903/g.66491 Transcript_30903/m.66491 type:complete len:202 (+) Transcript_30903:172-777(+)